MSAKILVTMTVSLSFRPVENFNYIKVTLFDLVVTLNVDEMAVIKDRNLSFSTPGSTLMGKET